MVSASSPQSGEVDVGALVEQAPFGFPQAMIVALCAIIITLDGFDMQLISFVAPVIAEQWGVERSAFGPIFAAGLFGLMAGQFICGPLADKLGRRSIILVCTAIFGIFTLLTSTAETMNHLLVYRFLTGIGLGGVMPNIIALASEFSPKRIRATVITIIFFGFPMGAVIGGIVSGVVIKTHSWQTVFLIGGALPLVCLVALFFLLPESLRYVVASNRPHEQAAKIVRRLWPTEAFAAASRFILNEQPFTGFSGKHLFRDGRATQTFLLWVVFFMNLLSVYFLISWLPLLVRQWGFPTDTAIKAGVVLNVGGAFGGVFLGWLIDRYRPQMVLASNYAAAAAFMALIALFGADIQVLMILIFFAGFFVIGGQTGLIAMCADVYPAAIRATGIGWAQGVGRIGSVIGPIVGGMLLAQAWTPSGLFALGATPSVIATIAVAALGFVIARRM